MAELMENTEQTTPVTQQTPAEQAPEKKPKKKLSRKARRRIVRLIILAVILGAAGFAAHHFLGGGGSSGRNTEVVTDTVQYGAITAKVDGNGLTKAKNSETITITTSGTGDGYGGKFKVLYPAAAVAGKTGSVQLSFTTDVYKYAVFYATCAEVNKYGQLQNYMCDTDPTVTIPPRWRGHRSLRRWRRKSGQSPCR